MADNSIAKHTPGPWRWELNEGSKSISLCGGVPTFDKTVMDFARWGMDGAAPRFNSKAAGDDFNIMERAEVFGAVAPGRAHHASWFKNLSHPDALLIAAAPDLLAALIELRATVKGECPSLLNEDSGGSAHLDTMIDEAIAKATGGAA